MHESYFVPAIGGWAPTPAAGGPWSGSVAGRLLGGLVARAAETHPDAVGAVPIRLHVDLLRPADAGAISTSVDLPARSGRLLHVAVSLVQHGREVARASVMMGRLAKAAAPDHGWAGSGAVAPPWPGGPVPESFGAGLLQADQEGGITADYSAWRSPGRRYALIEDRLPLTPGEETSPFVRAAMAADLVSPMTNWTSDGLAHINADYTMALARPPAGTRITLAALERIAGPQGAATCAATLLDDTGPFGTVTASAIIAHRAARADVGTST